MMPVNTQRFVDRSWQRNSDALEYDLEDSVPQSQKDAARAAMKGAIAIGLQGGAEVAVRINCSYVEADLEASVWPGLSRAMHPKSESAASIEHVDAVLTELERERGIRPWSIDVTAMIETAKGVANAYDIAFASDRVKAFGGAVGYDMAMDLGMEMFVGFDQFAYGKAECELVARTLGLQPDVNVYIPDTSGSVADTETAYASAVARRKAGGRSGGGLHPDLIEPHNRGFTPQPEDIEQALRVIAAFEQCDSRGDVEVVVEGLTVDMYEADRARELIEWSQACEIMDAGKAAAVEKTRARLEGQSS